MAIRINVADLRVMGRATQGVRLINLKGNDSIAAVAKVVNDADANEIDENGDIILDDQNKDGAVPADDSEE